MSITAEDIQNEGFEHSLRGYDVDQVDVFLERVANEVDEMNKTIAELTRQLEESQSAQPEDEGDEEPAAEEDAPSAEVLAEIDKANKKVADAIVRAEEAESRAKRAEARAERAEGQIEPLRKQLEEKSKLDSAISEAFISAQRSADQLKEEARAEGERIYRESEAKAREFIREALARKASVFNEIDELQKSADEFRDRYAALLQSFTEEASKKFEDVKPADIPEGIVNELLPDIDSMPVSAEEADSRPALDSSSIPSIEEPAGE